MGGPHSNMPGIDTGLSHPGLNNDSLSIYAPVCTSFILCKMPIYLNVYIYNNDIRPGNIYIQTNPLIIISIMYKQYTHETTIYNHNHSAV